MTESIALYSNFTPESGDDLWPFSSPSHLASFGGRRFVGSHFVIRPYRSYDEIYKDHYVGLGAESHSMATLHLTAFTYAKVDTRNDHVGALSLGVEPVP
jgi:hypothetical protein